MYKKIALMGFLAAITCGVTMVNQTGYISGLEMTYGGASNVTIAVGTCIDSDGKGYLNFTNTVTVTLPDDLDAGAEAPDMWYAVYIAKTNEAYEAVLSTNAATPVGYDAARRIGWIRNGPGGDLLDFRQSGSGRDRAYWYDEQKADLRVMGGGSATNYTTVGLGSLVPPTSKKATIEIEFKTGLGAGPEDNDSARIKAKDADWALARIQNGHKSGDFTYYRADILTDASQEVEYKVTHTKNRLGIMLLKWDDELK